MATDGVKIIDGDTAHDTYWGIMDLYDSEADYVIINKEFPLIQVITLMTLRTKFMLLHVP